LEYVDVDETIVLNHGQIVEQWWWEIAKRIKEQGFKK
jgi:Fe-S cluster assembly ATPase SufC